jgi:hypothetical protein
MLRRAARRAWRGATQPRRTFREALVLADLIDFRRRSSALRQARPRGRDRGVVLVVSLSDFVYQLKLEGVLAKALQLEGFEPVVLTHRGTRWAQPYFRSFGVERFLFQEDVLSAGSERDAERAAAEYLAGPVGVQSLKALEYRGAFVGQQTLSSLSRGFERGRISLENAEVAEALARLLPDAMRSVVVAERLLDEIDPAIVLFNEKGYAGFGSIYDVALERGADVIQFVATGIHSPNALILKRYTEETRRVHPASLSAGSWARVRALEWTPEREQQLQEEFALRYGSGSKHPDAGLQEGKAIKQPEHVRRELGLNPARGTAVIFSHVLWDANLFYGDDLFEDQEEWLVETVRAAAANPNVNWIVKLHPANMYKARGELNDEVAIRERVGELPGHVTLVAPDTDINTYALFPITDWGVTIRGTIGMELPCFGIPVLTAGTGRYAGFGFTVDSASREEYLSRLATIQEIPPLDAETTLIAKRHAYALFRLRPLEFTSYEASFMPASRLGHPLSHNLRLRLETPAAVEQAADLREFAGWAEDRALLDYLAPP